MYQKLFAEHPVFKSFKNTEYTDYLARLSPPMSSLSFDEETFHEKLLLVKFHDGHWHASTMGIVGCDTAVVLRLVDGGTECSKFSALFGYGRVRAIVFSELEWLYETFVRRMHAQHQ